MVVGKGEEGGERMGEIVFPSQNWVQYWRADLSINFRLVNCIRALRIKIEELRMPENEPDVGRTINFGQGKEGQIYNWHKDSSPFSQKKTFSQESVDMGSYLQTPPPLPGPKGRAPRAAFSAQPRTRCAHAPRLSVAALWSPTPSTTYSSVK
jgi:hypothetical protein